jgi:hypothetical protein
MPLTNLAGETFEALDERKWSRRDCTEYQDELNWEMRAFRRINGELEPAKMRRAARLREDRVDQGFHRATRIVGRILQAHEGRLREDGGPTAGRGHHGNLECPDEFLASHEPTEDSDNRESSIPMDRRPTLRVAEILGASRPEQSWNEGPPRRV